MTGIDAAVLDLTERACRAIQRLTGRTNVWVAVQLTNLSIVMYFVWAAAVYSQKLPVYARAGIAVLSGGLLYILSQTVFKVSIESSEQNAYARVAKGLRNPRRLRDAPLRLSFLTLSLLFMYPLIAVRQLHLQSAEAQRIVAIAFLGYSLVLLTTIMLYVIGCDPLPPTVGRIKEWLARTANARAAAQKQPIPQPIEPNRFNTRR